MSTASLVRRTSLVVALVAGTVLVPYLAPLTFLVALLVAGYVYHGPKRHARAEPTGLGDYLVYDHHGRLIAEGVDRNEAIRTLHREVTL